MEGKSVILSVVLMVLVMAQIQVEAKSCCRSTAARNVYNTCRFAGRSRSTCAAISGCKIVRGRCPSGWNKATQETDGDVVSEYCKLGCVSSDCDPIATLKNSDTSDVVNEAVEQCTNACTAFCAQGSATALEI